MAAGKAEANGTKATYSMFSLPGNLESGVAKIARTDSIPLRFRSHQLGFF